MRCLDPDYQWIGSVAVLGCCRAVIKTTARHGLMISFACPLLSVSLTSPALPLPRLLVHLVYTPLVLEAISDILFCPLLASHSYGTITSDRTCSPFLLIWLEVAVVYMLLLLLHALLTQPSRQAIGLRASVKIGGERTFLWIRQVLIQLPDA